MNSMWEVKKGDTRGWTYYSAFKGIESFTIVITDSYDDEGLEGLERLDFNFFLGHVSDVHDMYFIASQTRDNKRLRPELLPLDQREALSAINDYIIMEGI